MYFRILFVLNRVVISNPQRLAYTQIFVEYPPPGGGGKQVWGGKQVFKPGRSSFHVDMISFHFYCIHSLSRVIPRYRNNSNAVILDFSTVPIQTCYPSKSMTNTSVIFKGRYKPRSPGLGITRMNKRRGRESLGTGKRNLCSYFPVM